MPIYQLTLMTKKTVAKDTIEFTFTKPDNFHFIAGQYGGFTLINSDTKMPITRRFSLLSAPEESVIRITTRIQPSDFKKALLALKPNDSIKFAGPTGAFILHDDIDMPAVFIAGGVGITPFYSMITHCIHANIARPITLFYGNNTEEDAAYFDELRTLAKEHSSFKLIPIFKNPSSAWQGEKGLISASFIDNYIDCQKPAIFYACGSPAMVQAMQRGLAELDIPPDRIKIEDFPGY